MALILSFKGLDAKDGRLEAFSGTESAAGISRSLALIAHYAATGRVRHRFPFDNSVRFYLEATQPGSFDWTFILVGGGSLALGLATNGLYDLIKLVLSRAIGHDDVKVSQQIEDLNENRSGDIDALIEAVEPALKKGHYGIGETAKKIVLFDDVSKKALVQFDEESKAYLSESIEADVSEQDVSISALNVNDRTGRAYFRDLRRTVPFRISRDANPRTMGVLGTAIDRYANKTGAPTRITYRRIEAVDGRLKRAIISDARDITEEA